MTTIGTSTGQWNVKFGQLYINIDMECGEMWCAHQNVLGLTGLDIWDLIKRRPALQLSHPTLWEHFSGLAKRCQRIE
jgi:hypothetical protein